MRKAGFLIFLLPLLAPVSVAAASVHVSSTGSSNVSVSSQSNGESTTCVNGNCTTTGGESKSTVCVNGKCTESSGNVDIEDNSNGGSTSVHIKNTTNTTRSTSTGNTINDKDADDLKIGSGSGVKKHEASEEAKKMIKKMQEERKSFLDRIREILHNFFSFM